MGKRLVPALVLAMLSVAAPVLPGGKTSGVREWTIAVRPGKAVRAPGAFSLVGVAWPVSSADPARIEVRIGRGAWTELHVRDEEGPDAGLEGGGRVRSTDPLWVGSATVAAVRFTGPAPRGATLRLIDPGADPRPAWLASADASPAQPRIISRAEWGADESLRRAGPSYAPELKMTFVHHTATGNAYGPGESARIVRSIYAYHVLTRGWDDIGYNFLVDQYGQIFEGRGGGMDRPVIGAHAQGFNIGSAGFSIIGTYSSSAPPAEAYRALQEAMAWKLDLHWIDPRVTTTMVSKGSPRYPAGTEVSLPVISGHRDTGHTDCPGGALYASLPAVRDATAATGDPKLFYPGALRTELTPNGDGIADHAVVKGWFSSPVTWTAEVLDHAGGVVRRMTGQGMEATPAWDGRSDAGLPVGHGPYHLRFFGQNSNGTTRSWGTNVYLRAWPSGALLWARSTAWVLEGQVLRPFVSVRALESRFRLSEIVSVPRFVLDLYPHGWTMGFREGAVLRGGGSTWVISGARRREVSAETFSAMGYDAASIRDVTDTELGTHETGEPLATELFHPEGAALRGVTMPATWKLGGLGRTLYSDKVRASHGIRAVDLAGPADVEILASGTAPIGFRDGTLLHTPSNGRIDVVADGKRRWITSMERFGWLGYDLRNLVAVDDLEASLNPEGEPL